MRHSHVVFTWPLYRPRHVSIMPAAMTSPENKGGRYQIKSPRVVVCLRLIPARSSLPCLSPFPNTLTIPCELWKVKESNYR